MEMDRAKAMDRAFLMSRLFRREHFYDIVVAINNKEDRKQAATDFMNVCTKSAGLSEDQAVWLWNYLKRYKPELAWNQSVAPMNGW
jgi:hypothetical protein